MRKHKGERDGDGEGRQSSAAPFSFSPTSSLRDFGSFENINCFTTSFLNQGLIIGQNLLIFSGTNWTCKIGVKIFVYFILYIYILYVEYYISRKENLFNYKKSEMYEISFASFLFPERSVY